MRIVGEDKISVGWITGKHAPQRLFATFFLKAKFKLAPGASAAFVEGEAELVSGDVRLNNDESKSLLYASDFVPFKPRADVLLVGGACYPPGGRAVPACRARFRVGAHEKVLFVVGNRYWENGVGAVSSVSQPQPFARMEISYEQAFGGPGYPANPVGKGIGPVTSESGQALWPLPNIETTDQRVQSPSSRPQPGGFGPLDIGWEPRRNKVGSYGGGWLHKRWPGFPEDFDWGFFNSAPQGMQVDTYLRGDEELLFENLHPTHAIYRSRLPGIRARCFLSERYDDEKLQFREVPLNLDTLCVHMEAETFVLVWRGFAQVRSPKLKEIEHLFVVTEPLSEAPPPLAFYRSDFERRLVDPDELAAEEEDRQEEAKSAAEWVTFDRDFEQIEKETLETDKEFEELEVETSASEQGLIDKLLEYAHPSDIVDASPKPSTPEAFISDFAALKAKLAEEDPRHLENLDQPDFSALAELEAMDREMDRDMGEAMAEMEDEPPMTRDLVEAAARRGDSLAEAELANLDLSGLDLSGLDLSGADMRETQLTGSKLVESNLAGADLGGADLRDADLRRANLDDVDMMEAKLASVNWRGASLSDADLSGQELSQADFSGCFGQGTDFSKANLVGACFENARFPQADFSEANLRGVDFRRARLHAAQFDAVKATGIVMDHADISKLQAGDGSDFSNGSFRQARGEGSIWTESVLDRTDFGSACMTNADFSETSLVEANLDRADLSSAVFDDAVLKFARVTLANLLRASFERADLTGADLRGSNAYEAGFYETIVERTDLRGANLKNTMLEKQK